MKAEDTLWAGLTDSYAKIPMGITAENLGRYSSLQMYHEALSFSFILSSLHTIADMHDISREDSDAFALRSQQLWGKAHEAGVFKGEIGIFTITFLIIV